MKNRMRVILSFAVVFTCAAFGFAQGAAPAAPHDSARAGRIETSYDEVKDATTVRLNPMQVYGEPPSSLKYAGRDGARLSASFTYPGRTLSAPPERVLITLISTSEDWKYKDSRKLTAVVDGERLKIGPLEYAPSFTVKAPADSNSGDSVSQEIAISLPRKTFLRIARGKKVRIRMGPRGFKLEENHLEALRTLAGLVDP